MNLPQNAIQAGKQSIQACWDDKVTALRKKKVNLVEKDFPIYTDIKCHFSQGLLSALNQTDTVAITTSIFTLYIDTDIDIKAGDTLVITHKNQVFKGVAGQPFNGNFSNSIKVEVKSIA